MFSKSSEWRKTAGFLYRHGPFLAIALLFALAMWVTESPKRYVPLVAVDLVILVLLLNEAGVLPL